MALSSEGDASDRINRRGGIGEPVACRAADGLDDPGGPGVLHDGSQDDAAQRQWAASSGKVLSLEALLARREEHRRHGKTVVWTNGCFDLLHVGHIRSLQAARRLGDVLIVGVNSDDSVRRLKGPARPLIVADERCEMLAALECVDLVTVFDEDTPVHILSVLRPDIHCKGTDYAPPDGKPIPEAQAVAAYGGRIAFLPMVPSRSTSALVQRLLGSP
jgi:rfaE bifunctional protein nucleotidyltransferase chain/domain